MMSCFCIECERNARASEDARIDAGQERAMREAAERVTDKVRQERDALRAEVERLRRAAQRHAKQFDCPDRRLVIHHPANCARCSAHDALVAALEVAR